VQSRDEEKALRSMLNAIKLLEHSYTHSVCNVLGLRAIYVELLHGLFPGGFEGAVSMSTIGKVMLLIHSDRSYWLTILCLQRISCVNSSTCRSLLRISASMAVWVIVFSSYHFQLATRLLL
jgi:hypothetical protein